jgi:hypothetical protein
MRKVVGFVLIILAIFSSCKQKPQVGANGVEFTSPQQYNDYIITKQKEIVKDMQDYGNASQVNADSAENILNNTISKLTKIIDDLKGMPAYNGDSSFRDAAVELFTFYKKSFGTDFKEMLDINRKVENDTYDESDIARFKQIEENISKKESPLDAKLKDVQGKFAKANNLKLSK